jgi:hypothetical protein
VVVETTEAGAVVEEVVVDGDVEAEAVAVVVVALVAVAEGVTSHRRRISLALAHPHHPTNQVAITKASRMKLARKVRARASSGINPHYLLSLLSLASLLQSHRYNHPANGVHCLR